MTVPPSSTIRSATNGLRAFDLVALAAEGTIPFPDVILFDIDLPILSGITLLKVLHMSDIRGKENIVFILTASVLSERDKQVARSLGVSAFLPKPLLAQNLDTVLRSIYFPEYEGAGDVKIHTEVKLGKNAPLPATNE